MNNCYGYVILCDIFSWNKKNTDGKNCVEVWAYEHTVPSEPEGRYKAPIEGGGADYSHHITICPLPRGSSGISTALKYIYIYISGFSDLEISPGNHRALWFMEIFCTQYVVPNKRVAFLFYLRKIFAPTWLYSELHNTFVTFQERPKNSALINLHGHNGICVWNYNFWPKDDSEKWPNFCKFLHAVHKKVT